jgi:hypothetical protein
MCNCGHEQRSAAQRLKQQSTAAILCALCVAMVLITLSREHPPLMFGAVLIPAGLIVLAAMLMRRRRRVLCGQM